MNSGSTSIYRVVASNSSQCRSGFSEQSELLPRRSENLVLLDLDDVEANSLGKRSALRHGGDVTLLDIKAWRAMDSDILVALLETVVLLDVVEVVATDNDGSLHLGGDDHAPQHSATNAHIASEWALLVNVLGFLGFFRGGESEADVAPVSHVLL